ncbi:uncharacterized protein LOC110466866 [Mizuhopecten yessoensis]|uniref:Kazal-like domain-containing protein n=1 Tax=Mizuhopecten yessoensis TaxID=6573 RepID=A0A210PNF3_MIZYE|nr:uncharacterized protein LOC110466866 [Mizuhopecten yessoensis]OWF38018.1 hypothetical protein KP79_PYT14335 [Mizuhopecten yessoensis]
MFRLYTTLAVFLCVLGTVWGSLQDCLDVVDTNCPPEATTHVDQYFCDDKGRVYNGSCQLQEHFCRLTFFHNESFHLTKLGPNCDHPLYVAAVPRPLTSEETNLFASMVHGVDDRLKRTEAAGTTANVSKPIFSKQDHTHKVYQRNPHCWAHDLDLTPISPWNSYGKTRKAGTLLSPRHAVWARHYSIRVNSTLRFVDRHNNVVDRRVIKTRALYTNASAHQSFLFGHDMVIGLLDSDVPSTISFAKVLPRNFTVLMPSRERVRLPVFSTDFEEKALVADFSNMRGTMASLIEPITTSTRHKYYERKISGDSGNPSFFIIDDQLVFLFVFTFGGSGSGTSVQHNFNEINSIMEHLGGGYQLTEVDLSRFVSAAHVNALFGDHIFG